MIQISALPLLAYKVGPNLFDLSSQMYHVSIRDQMHRAVALAEALVDGQQFKVFNQVLIVGAGVAGISAGIVLARHGVEVQIIDASSDAPFALQRHVQARYVGPYMYEWPLEVHTSQKMPPDPFSALAPWDTGKAPALPFTAADPVPPLNLVTDWEAALERAIFDADGRLRLQTGVNALATNAAVNNWLVVERLAYQSGVAHVPASVAVTGGQPWRNSALPHQPLRPRCVLLAAGMGTEINQIKDQHGGVLVQGKSFWADDDILAHQCGFPKKPRLVILGGGDGALQDMLRALTRDRHPVDTWRKLLPLDHHGLMAGSLPRLTALESQHAQTSIWARDDALRVDTQKVLDAAYEALAKELAQNAALAGAVIAMLRDDVESVHLCVRESYFSKAYALNRFMVHLFEQCVQSCGSGSIQNRFQVCRQWELDGATTTAGVTDLQFTNSQHLAADLVVVRFGTNTSQLPGQWLGLSKKDTVNRQELAAVPLPLYFPPSR